MVTLYLSQVFIGLALGRFILPDRWGDLGRGYNLLAMTIGVIILFAPRFIPLPFLDPAISVVVALLGLGAAMVGVTMRRYSPSYGDHLDRFFRPSQGPGGLTVHRRAGWR